MNFVKDGDYFYPENEAQPCFRVGPYGLEPISAEPSERLWKSFEKAASRHLKKDSPGVTYRRCEGAFLIQGSEQVSGLTRASYGYASVSGDWSVCVVIERLVSGEWQYVETYRLERAFEYLWENNQDLLMKMLS